MLSVNESVLCMGGPPGPEVRGAAATRLPAAIEGNRELSHSTTLPPQVTARTVSPSSMSSKAALLGKCQPAGTTHDAAASSLIHVGSLGHGGTATAPHMVKGKRIVEGTHVDTAALARLVCSAPAAARLRLWQLMQRAVLQHTLQELLRTSPQWASSVGTSSASVRTCGILLVTSHC
jgi:hypothetical protein